MSIKGLNFVSGEEIDGYIPDNNSSKAKNPYDKKNFRYNPERDVYTCPMEQPLSFIRENFDRQKNKMVKLYRGQACLNCGEQQQCTGRKDGVRHIKMFPHEMQRNAMTAKMATDKAKEIYKLRQQIIEPVFGDIKENKGMRTFLTRGLKTVRGEFQLICAAVNIKKIWARIRYNNGKPGGLTSLLLPSPIYLQY